MSDCTPEVKPRPRDLLYDLMYRYEHSTGDRLEHIRANVGFRRDFMYNLSPGEIYHYMPHESAPQFSSNQFTFEDVLVTCDIPVKHTTLFAVHRHHHHYP